jgi:hypothetical protein
VRNELPQPSPIAFPVALQPDYEQTARIEDVAERWGWLEIFVLTQVFWGVLLFMPGSQAYRTSIRAFPYVASLGALIGCARAGRAGFTAPGARWIMAAIILLIANLVHDQTWVRAGIAQIVFQVAIAAPVFWAAGLISESRLNRLMLLIFGANFLSAALGLLQVYYPDTFLPPEFSALALRFNPEFVNEMTYVGGGGRMIVRPPGLSDMPGGASISGTMAALLGFALALRPGQRQTWRLAYFAAAAIAITVVYLTQVRSMLLMIPGGMAVMALIKLRQGRVLQSGWVAASAGVLVFGGFMWAVTVGGGIVEERYRGIVDAGVVQAYQENRGMFLSHTVNDLAFDYPFGAGLGRWGMMTAYFGEHENWRNPALHAEIQLTGWLYDGGLLMWVFYPAALLIAIRHSYGLAVDPEDELNEFAMIVLAIQLLTVALAFTGPVFNTQVGIIFWLVTAVLYGCQRTRALAAWNAEQEAESTEHDAAAPHF